jgi:hypothetical protein
MLSLETIIISPGVIHYCVHLRLVWEPLARAGCNHTSSELDVIIRLQSVMSCVRVTRICCA